MRVLVTFAVEAELAPWRKLRKLNQVAISGLTRYQAEIGHAVVDLVVTGMGAKNARQAMQEAMASPYSFCIASGFAGALRPGCKVGEIVVARAVQQFGDARIIECASNLVTEAIQDGAKPVSLLLATDHVVSTAEEKSRLAPFAEAVDMESFSVLAVARAHQLPAVAIRVVSDSHDRDMPANIGRTADEKGNVRVGGVMKYVATHPLALPALIRLGRESRIAAEALAHFVETYIKKLSFEAQDWVPAELEDIAAT